MLKIYISIFYLLQVLNIYLDISYLKMVLSDRAKKYEQTPSCENKRLLEEEVERLKGQRLYAKMNDPSNWMAIAVFGLAATTKPRIVDHAGRRRAREELLNVYKTATSPAVRDVISRGLDISDTVNALTKKMKDGEPLGLKEKGDIYTHSHNAETRVDAGIKIGISYAAIWHANYGRLRKLIYDKKLVGDNLFSTVFAETERLHKILCSAQKTYPVEHPDKVKDALEKIHDDSETMKPDRVFIGELLDLPQAYTFSKELDTCNLSRTELRTVYQSKDVPAAARQRAGEKLGYSGIRIWVHDHPVTAVLLTPVLPIIGIAKILMTIGDAVAIKTGEPDDGCESYHGGAGWGWIEENGDYHKGDNR